jgi:hypothetical protein
VWKKILEGLMASGRISVIALIFIILLFISGCASGRLGGGIITGSAAVDLVNYTNQGLLNIAELERRSLETYASVIGENYTTDQRVYEALRDFVIPVYKRFLDALRDIRPENEEIKRVHSIYIQGAGLIYDGFNMKMLGIENGNEDIIIQGNERIEKGREEVERWRLELIELYKKHGVAEIKEE